MDVNNDILSNAPLISAFSAWLIAQFLKPFISKMMGDGFNPHMFLSTGGMPSSHSATVIALTTSVGIKLGIGSIPFAVCLIFSIIVIHDAMNIMSRLSLLSMQKRHMSSYVAPSFRGM